jgi:hypothetical protein
VAEQKSFDIAWDLLQEKRFAELLSTICGTPQELRRFRALVINSVMATDLGDQQLKELRNGRWQKAFAKDETVNTSSCESSTSLSQDSPAVGRESKETRINRKATIVIEQ